MYLVIVQIILKIKLTLVYLYKNFLYELSNFEGDIELKKQYRIKKLPVPLSIGKAASKIMLIKHSKLI